MKYRLTDIGIVVAPLLLVIDMFFLPLSPTLLSVFLACGSLVLISIPYYRRISFYTWFSTSGCFAIGLLAFVFLATLWSPASYFMRFTVGFKYFKLFYLPIVAVSFINPKMRFWALNAFILAMIVTMLISIGMSFGYLALPVSQDPGEVFHNHIITSFMVAFTCYLSALFAFNHSGWQRIFYIFVFLLSNYQMVFINTGRTGYITYCILMTLFFVQKLSYRRACTAFLIFVGCMLLAYQLSPQLHNRIQSLVHDVHLFADKQKETSLGYRMEFHKYAESLVADRPLIGVGTGGFKYHFERDNPLPKWGTDLNDPHGQYWFVLAEQGLIGLGLFIGFLLSLIYLSFKLNEMKPILLGFTVVFAVACFTDTIFSYSVLGYLLIMITAICFGELHEMRENRLLSDLGSVREPVANELGCAL